MIGGLPAYAMYDLGKGVFWNELALSGNLKAKNYQQSVLTIDQAVCDTYRGEVELHLKTRNDDCYSFIFFNQTLFRSLMHNNNVDVAKDLVGRKVMGLFDHYGLQWIVSACKPVEVIKDSYV